MTKQISDERKAAFYIGTALTVVGLLLFLSVLVGSALGGDGFVSPARALAGMGLMAIGGFVRGIGERGIAGSGLVLNPPQARRDLEPFSRMAGGMLEDALDEANVDLTRRSERIVMLKCASCSKLNEVDSKFCQECGQEM